MWAMRVDRFGAADVLRPAEVPDPAPGPGELLVAITAAGVNRADLLFRSGGYHRAPALPAVPRLEAAGTVVAVGAEVDGFAVGDPVMAWGATGEPGFYAEQAVVPAIRALRLAAGVDRVWASVLPVAWLSAWYCLHRLAQVAPGDVVLVLSAASGVGSAAVQIARDAGASVIAGAGSAEKRAWLHELGVGHVIDQHDADVVAQVRRITGGRGADVVLDLVGGETFATALRAVGRAGRVVAMANVALAPSTIDTRDFYPRNVHIHGFQITDLIEHGWDPRPDLGALVEAIVGGRVWVPVDTVFPLHRPADAHRRLESRAALGKVVLTTGDPR